MCWECSRWLNVSSIFGAFSGGAKGALDVYKGAKAASQVASQSTKTMGYTDDVAKIATNADDTVKALQTYYPPNNGALGNTERVFLMPGKKIDRLGKMSGKYFAPKGTPLEMRAMPPNADLSQYRVFEVLKPLEVEKSTIAPYFNKIGLGKQFESPVSAKVLVKRGIIKILEGGK